MALPTSHNPGGTHGRATFLGHPAGLFLLFVVEMWERFSYYGMRALLVLYLVSNISAFQLKPDTYFNTLTIEELSPGGGSAEPTIAASRSVPYRIEVGKGAVGAEPPTVPAPTGEFTLRFQSLRQTKDAKGESVWEPDSSATDAFSPVTLVGDPGNKGAFLNGDTAWRVSNPTDREIEVRFDITPDPEQGRTYISPNNTRGKSLTVKIKPDSQRTEKDPPFDLVVSTNNSDSGRNWSAKSASTLYGWYTGLAYLFPVIGGILADRFIGTHRSMVLGAILIALGHITLGVSGLGEMAQSREGLAAFIGGLALIVLGTGHFKPCVSTMVGELYEPGDARRDGGFSIFYMGINLGAFLAPLGCGYLASAYGWHYGFGLAAAGMIAGLFTYLIGKPVLLRGIGAPPPNRPNISFLLFAISCALSALLAFAFYQGFFTALGEQVASIQQNALLTKALTFGGLFAVIVAVGWFVAIQRPGDKGPTFSIFLFMLFNAFFWIAFEQAGGSMNIFAEQNTDRVIGTFEIPAAWFQSVNAIFIVLIAPVFAWLWGWLGKRNMNPTQPAKIGLGLVLVAAGFVFMVLGGMQASKGVLVTPFWLVAAYFIHTLGELCLSPTGLSYVTKAAPVRFVSLLMGVWFISSFIANLGAGLIGAQVEAIERGEIDLPWDLGGQADFYLLFVIVPGGVGLLVLLCTPLLKMLLRSKTD